ncbi:MAG: putative glycosyltransferase EpsE [Pedosphaera sp.]|nr:putative glycosyltransferase EpsE [Pedosphaera sp.]
MNRDKQNDGKPLLTFSIGAYNQEAFIRQAVEGAFAQTYSPLQIILSDDCSKDRTFEIMAEMAAAYRGSHEVVLNRNPKNVGLVAHVNRLVQLMRGELLVVSAGDDISLPNRTSTVFEAWEASGRRAFGVHSTVIHIDEAYQPGPAEPPTPVPAGSHHFQDGPAHVKSYIRSGAPVVLGCTAAYSRTLFERFGPLPEYMVFEDMALTFRALLSGGLAFVDHPLVLYRLHSTNIHHSKVEYVVTRQALLADEERKKTMLKRKLSVARSFRADLEKASTLNLIREPDYTALNGELNWFEQANAWELDYRGAGFLRRLVLFLQLAAGRVRFTPNSGRLFYRLLPTWCYCSARILKNRVRSKLTRLAA